MLPAKDQETLQTTSGNGSGFSNFFFHSPSLPSWVQINTVLSYSKRKEVLASNWPNKCERNQVMGQMQHPEPNLCVHSRLRFLSKCHSHLYNQQLINLQIFNKLSHPPDANLFGIVPSIGEAEVKAPGTTLGAHETAFTPIE